MEKAEEIVANYLDETIRVLEATRKSHLRDIVQIAERVMQSIRNGGTLLLLGNGGSCLDAQHVVGELVGELAIKERPPISCDTFVGMGLLTALSNDRGWDPAFARWIESRARPEDVLILISTSGNSTNMVAAANAARARGVFTIGLTGRSGGALREHCDRCLTVPSTMTQHIQDAHRPLLHVLAILIELARSDPAHAGLLDGGG